MCEETDTSFLQSRQKYYKYNRQQHFDGDDIFNLFNKKFQFRFNSEWSLPINDMWFSDLPWSVKELNIIKSKLNYHKSQLNDFNIEEWSSHTRRRNPAGEVCWKVRCLINPEFLTQAWTKFYECAYTYSIIPQQAISQENMVSLHLCEAPGAFITSLNHYIKSNYPNIKWEWVASTLNPYYEGNSPSNMIADDRFMFHTLPNWDFGLDNTGNLMDWDNSQAIIQRARALGKVLLVTADGSIDCLQKPDAQEEVTSPLHYCEIVTAIQALSAGGTLVFKLFTVFEHTTVNLLYLINHLFHEVNIYKPVTSRQGNSEVYAVCLNFKGSASLTPFIPILKHGYGSETYLKNALFPLTSIPKDFLKQIEECASYFCSIQCQVINNNLQAYLMQKNISLHTDMKKVRNAVATAFIRNYNLKPLLYDMEILKGCLHEDDMKINTNPRQDRGSFSERQMYNVMSLKEKSKSLLAILQNIPFTNSITFSDKPIIWISMYEENYIFKLNFTYGKPLDNINSSKFIFVPIFKLYQSILDEPEFKEIILSRQNKKTSDSDDLNLLTEVSEWKTIIIPEFDLIENYSSYEKLCFQMVFDAVKNLSVHDSLLLQNFNTLTHFNVSVLYILCKYFEKTGFTATGSIFLENLMNKSVDGYLTVINDECESVKSATKDVLSNLPVQVTNSEIFFNNLVFFNNTYYRNKCMQYLNVIQQSV